MKNLDDSVWLLLQDDQFIKWVHSPNEDTIAYWEKWMEEHPEGLPTLFKAREIARDLAYTEKPADAEQFSTMIWTGIQDSLEAGSVVTSPSTVSRIPEGIAYASVIPLAGRTGRSKTWYWMAASLIGLLILGAGLFYSPSGSRTVTAGQKIASLIVKEDLESVNQTAGNQTIYLVDGSTVILQPGAKIRRALFLQKNKREIFLEGNAFFTVAKDAGRPFYVYTKDLVVRVLGTSFTMTTDKENGDVTVLVRTGKVSVTKKTDSSSEQRQVILTPDQKAFYKARARKLLQMVPDKKELSTDQVPAAPAINFNFEDMPVVKIFETLENAYGIPLRYDEKMFAACQITTSLADESFEEKLKIICEAIGAEYRINKDSVIIESKGGKPCR
ncbi:FecR family protein [Flavitalea flava]